MTRLSIMFDNEIDKAEWLEDKTNTDPRFRVFRAEVGSVRLLACLYDGGVDGTAMRPGLVYRCSPEQRKTVYTKLRTL